MHYVPHQNHLAGNHLVIQSTDYDYFLENGKMIRCTGGGHILNNIDTTPCADCDCTLDGKIIQFGFTFLVNREHVFYLFGGTLLANR